MMFRSFVDLVFILLCAVLVLLTNSVQLKGLSADVSDVGEHESNAIDPHETLIVVVSEDWLGIDGKHLSDVSEVQSALKAQSKTSVVVIPETSSVSHHRVIETWWTLKQSGWRVELGVRPETSKAST